MVLVCHSAKKNTNNFFSTSWYKKAIQIIFSVDPSTKKQYKYIIFVIVCINNKLD